MIIKADLHIHSKSSIDGRSEISEIVKAAANRGIDAIAITDHDICSVLPQSNDVLLIPAAEITTDAGHILALFLETPIDMKSLFDASSIVNAEKAIQVIHAHGGIAVWAHPFAPQKANKKQFQNLEIDAVETQNARAPLKDVAANQKARELAALRSLPCVGGSDAHHASEIGSCYTEFECNAKTIEDLRRALRCGDCRAVFVHSCSKTKKALSQMHKARQNGFVPFCRSLIYFAWSLIQDIFQKQRRNKGI